MTPYRLDLKHHLGRSGYLENVSATFVHVGGYNLTYRVLRMGIECEVLKHEGHHNIENEVWLSTFFKEYR